MDNHSYIGGSEIKSPDSSRVNSDSDPRSSFIRFIFTGKRNDTLLSIAVVATGLQFIVFKLLYPFPDFFSDSYSYLYAAYAHLDINIWPIGYSKFLSAFHEFTHSDTALIAFQYFFLELSAIYFFFSIIYFFNPGKIIVNILFAFLFFNPLFLYLSNYVNSDPIFAALSLCWITQLIWIIHRPKPSQIFVQAILLFACFTVRNNAYYYPIISAIAFGISRQRLWIRVTGALAGLVLIIPFVIHSRNEAYKMTGTEQFSLFTGWQLANNALYIYDKIQVDSAALPTEETRQLDRLSRQYLKRILVGFTYRKLYSAYVGNYFIREPDAPLKQYMSRYYKITDDNSVVEAWGKSSAVFADYGTYIIKNNPTAFFKYYMLPNAVNYFFPPLEKLEIYNLGMNTTDPIAQYWFDYPSDKLGAVSKDLQGKILYFFPLIFGLLNIYVLAIVALYIIQKKYKHVSKEQNKTIILISSLLVANAGFCIFSTIIVFRYEFFPMIACLAISLLMTEWMEKRKPETNQLIEEQHGDNVSLRNLAKINVESYP